MKPNFFRSISLILSLLLVLSACGAEAPVSWQPSGIPGEEFGRICAAVVYLPGDGNTWEDTLGYLQQSTMIGLEAEGVPAGADYEAYHLLYLDGSLAGLSQEEVSRIADYVRRGGMVVADNALWNTFGRDFFGAKEFAPVEGCPVELDVKNAGADFREIQTIITDFAQLYQGYADYAGTLSGQDYGYAMVCDTAQPLLSKDGLGLYTVNNYGQGQVFFCNALCPNFYNASGFFMDAREGQLNFASTTASANQLLTNAFAQYLSRQRYGFSMSRVFGTNGSPAMAWELHYEEITGIENGSMQLFDALCREYQQIPSFTFIRNSYEWFLRAESVSFYLNQGSSGEPEFHLDFYESAYSSGTHVAANQRWLTLAEIPDAGSYFVDDPEYTQRAYPELCDLNGDGLVDILCGSSDGLVYFFSGCGFTDRLHTSEAVILTDCEQQPIQASGGFSAPALGDLDGDGIMDLLLGDGTGRVVWYKGKGGLSFTPMGLLLDSSIAGQVFPALGDLNGDGIPELALGSNRGSLLIFDGSIQEGSLTFSHSHMATLSLAAANAELGTWLAPEISGGMLLIGTMDGYVARAEPENTGYAITGYLTTDEKNYKGNDRLKTGNNCVPVVWDINGDGAEDLLCGALEYGMAYPIDSPYFPLPEQVREQLAYAAENHLYVGPHFYTNAYASQEREAYEIAAHLKALASYGLDAKGLGANQHTWYTSSFSQSQSMDSLYAGGLSWQSGFGAAGGTNRNPQTSAENALPLPFFLLSQEGEKTLLVQNCSVLPYLRGNVADTAGEYGAPVCIYYHCDFVYEDDSDDRRDLQTMSEYWWKYGYNFLREDQMMKAISAAYALDVAVSGSLEEGLTLTPEYRAIEYPLGDERYDRSCGIRVTFRGDLDAEDFVCDAAVLHRQENAIYFSLSDQVTIRPGTGEESALVRVNLPANITQGEDGMCLEFLDSGMHQIVVKGKAIAQEDGWTAIAREGHTILTHYGAACTVHITY